VDKAWLNNDIMWKAEMLFNNNWIFTEEQWEDFCDKMEEYAQILLTEPHSDCTLSDCRQCDGT